MAEKTLEAQLEELLDQETFSPPDEFAEQAVVTDAGSTSRRRPDPEGVLGRAGRGAALGRELGSGARLVRPAVRQVVRRRQAQRLLQLRRSPRGSRQRRPRGVPLARRGGRGARHHLRGPAPRRPEVRQRAQGPRDRRGRRRRDLPADDPRGRRGDARLRAHRRPAQRRVRRLLAESVKERMEFSEAKALITVDGARRKGKTAPIKQQVDEVMGDVESSRRSSSSSTPGPTARCRRAATSGAHECVEAAGDECPAEPLDAEHPLYILYTQRLDREAEGHPAHHRRLPDAGRVRPTATCSTSSPRRTSTGARPTSAGSPGTPTSSTGRSPTAARR